ncbi:MAG: LacI family transcriptional regulator [Anaerolineae bacterium]|nr:LacI family transcriptional regulator [Anaerolineae bacterium]
MTVLTKRRVTIRQVAEEAGVSTQTVSRVINNRPDVAPATRQRVQEVIARLGYQPSYFARSLVQGRSFTIGVVGYGLDYFGPSCTLAGIEREASQLGYRLLLSLIRQPETNRVDQLLGEMLSRHVDGLIWAVPEIGDNRAWVDQAHELPVPIVFLTMEPRPDRFVIAVDNYSGALMATRHLIAQGCKTVGLITGPLDWWEARQRQAGWRDALASVGLPHEDSLIAKGNWSAASGEAGFDRLLAQHPEIDGVFACNDQMALGVLRAARRLGRRVPGELAVVGFDDWPEAAYLYPSLSTVRQDMVELGRRAVRVLDQAIETVQGGTVPAPKTVLLQPELIVRESSFLDKR